MASNTPAAMVGWTYDPTMINSNPTQLAALIAMGPSTGGAIHPGGGGCADGSGCCWGADMAVLTFAVPMPRTVMKPLRLIAPQGDEPECSGADTCVTVIGTGIANEDSCDDSNAPASALDTTATQVFVESGLGDGHCPGNGDMLYGEYDFDDSSTCRGDSGSPILWSSGELMAQNRGRGGDGGDDVVGPVLWTGGPNTARDFYVQNAADRDGDGVQAADDNCDRTHNPAQGDFNGDQIGDACQDSDGDGLNDSLEIVAGTSPNSADTDSDGLLDPDELARGTNPLHRDSDGDGLFDGREVWEFATDPLDADTDDDDLRDGQEVQLKGDPWVHDLDRRDPLYISSPTNPDTDGDGLLDGSEVLGLFTNPRDPDTDHDGLDDRAEVWKVATNPLHPDTDVDGMPDGGELDFGTDPNVADSDGDGILDGDEDFDRDRLGDGFEVAHGTDPRNPDSDGDSIVDCQDVTWILAQAATLDSADYAPGITPKRFSRLLDKAEHYEAIGDFTSAKLALDAMRSYVDGCGAVADADDWLVWCPSQTELRAAVDAVRAHL